MHGVRHAGAQRALITAEVTMLVTSDRVQATGTPAVHHITGNQPPSKQAAALVVASKCSTPSLHHWQ
jgi:hypothetical protein